MRKFILVNNNGFIIGRCFLGSNNPKDKPSNGIEVSDTEFEKIYNNKERWKWNFGTQQWEKVKPPINEYKREILLTLKAKMKEMFENSEDILQAIIDYQIIGNTTKVSKLKQQYQDLLLQRKLIRDWALTKRSEIQNATTYEELDAILVEIEQYEGQ